MSMEPAPNFEQFTGQARRAILLAYQEAQRFDHDFLASEHLLGGIVREGSSEIAHVFREQGIGPDEILEKLEQSLAQAQPGPMSASICLTPRARYALVAAADLARDAQEGRVDSPQILLALIDDSEGTTRPFLEELGFDADRGCAALRQARVAPNRDLLVTVDDRELSRATANRVDPTAAQLTHLLSGHPPQVEMDLTAPAEINSAIAESDFQLFLTQMMLALTLGLAGGYSIYQSIDGMAAAAVIFGLIACFRNSLVGLAAGATLGGMIAQKVQPGNGALDTPIEAFAPLILVGGFIGSFIGNYWRRFTPKYLHPSMTHRKPPGVV